MLDRAGFEPRSHDGRALANIIETFPRDELFQVTDDQLLEVALGILHLQQRQRVAVFVRRDDFDRFISCLVFVPRDRYTTQLRLAIQSILERAFAGEVAAHYLQVGDAPLARLHIVVQTTPGEIPTFDVRELEAEIVAATRSWSDRLLDALQPAHGEEEAPPAAPALRQRLSARLPRALQRRAGDGRHRRDRTHASPTAVSSWRSTGRSPPPRCTSASRSISRISRSCCRTCCRSWSTWGCASSTRCRTPSASPATAQRTVMIHDFGLETQTGRRIELAHVGERFEEAFLAVWDGHVESDGLNALVLSAGLDVRQVTVLRAYEKYLRQAGIPFTQAYLEQVLTAHPAITGAILRLFLALFDPDASGRSGEPGGTAARRDRRSARRGGERRRRPHPAPLPQPRRGDAAHQLLPDRNDGAPKPYLSIKLDSRKVDDLPLPRPMVEIFVYSRRVEGIHLRGGKVARGGIRWSDRREDFRTEILGLMKAQTVKNAVIVPVGAKGGFVVKRPPDPTDREAWQAEGIACYRTLIRGLLDLTDNRVGGGIVPPPRVVRRDGDDPYLVVAADKGTATFSDIANGIAAEYGFWLGDAFASGGSRGYDHKVMGITAQGAWEGVKRHFREMGRDIQKEDFTVVGVGDMSGDVFGNGMLLSPHIRLLAAFDHRHIFIDPDPDRGDQLRRAPAAVRAAALVVGELRRGAAVGRAAASSTAAPSRWCSRPRSGPASASTPSG